jgi:hypothetical protein
MSRSWSQTQPDRAPLCDGDKVDSFAPTGVPDRGANLFASGAPRNGSQRDRSGKRWSTVDRMHRHTMNLFADLSRIDIEKCLNLDASPLQLETEALANRPRPMENHRAIPAQKLLPQMMRLASHERRDRVAPIGS